MFFEKVVYKGVVRLLTMSKERWATCAFAIVAIVIAPLPSAEELNTPCDPTAEVDLICGLQRPEDLELMLGEKLLLVSEYGSLDGSKSGSLSSYRIHDGVIERLFPHNQSDASKQGGQSKWGAANCPGPPGKEFSPHGIYHNTLIAPNRLAVVNHGGRESIELFEVSLGDGGLNMTLNWRGCVIAPEGAWFNDVVGLPDGSLIASHMMSRGLDHHQLVALESSKENTGHIFQWSREAGWQKVKNSEGALPNGIEVSPDGKVLFINYYFGDKVAALELKSGKRLWQADVPGPDNSSWASDGGLLIASHLENLNAVSSCTASSEAFCPLRYAVVSLDPKTGVKKQLLVGGGAPFGGATVAVQVGQDLFLGSYAGTRMAKRPMPSGDNP